MPDGERGEVVVASGGRAFGELPRARAFVKVMEEESSGEMASLG